MLWLLKILDLSLHKENIHYSLSLITWTAVPAMLCIIFFHAKHTQNNTQAVLKVLNLDLTITSQAIWVALKGLPPNKRHFTLTLRMANIMVLIITLSDQTDSIDNLRRRESIREDELDTFQSNGPNELDTAPFERLIYLTFS